MKTGETYNKLKSDANQEFDYKGFTVFLVLILASMIVASLSTYTILYYFEILKLRTL